MIAKSVEKKRQLPLHIPTRSSSYFPNGMNLKEKNADMHLAMLLTQSVVALKGIYLFSGSVIVRSSGFIISSATHHAITDPCLHDRCQHT